MNANTMGEHRPQLAERPAPHRLNDAEWRALCARVNDRSSEPLDDAERDAFTVEAARRGRLELIVAATRTRREPPPPRPVERRWTERMSNGDIVIRTKLEWPDGPPPKEPVIRFVDAPPDPPRVLTSAERAHFDRRINGDELARGLAYCAGVPGATGALAQAQLAALRNEGGA